MSWTALVAALVAWKARNLSTLDWGKLALAFFAVVVAVGLGFGWYKERQARQDAIMQNKVLLTINDSTIARAALLKRQNGQLKALVDAAKTIGGKPVAGVKIVIKPDTVYLEQKEVPTDSVSSDSATTDSTRYATLTDSTDGYEVRIEATAPPYPANLKLGYQIVTPKLTPEVGFVKKDGAYYAVVSIAGKDYDIAEAFFTPEKEDPLYLALGGGLTTNTGFNAYGAIKYRASPKIMTDLRAGRDEGFYIGLTIESKIW